MAPAPTTAVVVRCHNPTDAALTRIGAWARSLDGSGVALVVSVDQTTQGSSRRRARRGRSRGPARRVAAALGGLGRVHVYDERALVAAYPCLAAAAATAHVAGAREFRTGAVSLAWGFHCECLNLWYQALARKFDFVWKLEDDVGYSGDLREFVGRFDAEPADLLTADAGHRPGSRWWWADAATPAYLAAYAPRDRLASREHAQRFSRRLLDRLHDLHGRGVTAWSEALAVTVCAAAPDLVLERLPPSVLGDPYAHDGRVSERAWRDVVDGRSARRKRKLYHALKF